MLRRFEDCLDAPRLDDFAMPHHRDIVGKLAHDVEIMRDEQHRHSVPLLQILQERENLRLHRNIERGRRFVGDEEIGPVGEAHGNHHALTLTAGKLMRIGRKALRRIGNADLAQQFDDTPRQRRPFARTVKLENLADLPRDRLQRVERGHRLLEDHGDGGAADRAQAPLAAFQKILALEQGRSRDLRARRQQPQDRQRRHRLARARFADQRKCAAAPKRERNIIDHLGALTLRKANRKIADFEERNVRHAERPGLSLRPYRQDEYGKARREVFCRLCHMT